MEQYVGLDVSQEQTSICVVDGGGKVIWEGKCASTPEAIAATIRTRAPEAARIGLESGPLSAWHWCTACSFWDTGLHPTRRWQQFEAASGEIGLA